jgi:hypothetical protein
MSEQTKRLLEFWMDKRRYQTAIQRETSRRRALALLRIEDVDLDLVYRTIPEVGMLLGAKGELA